MSLEKNVEQAKEGDRAALERVVIAIQDDIYRLAIRMLWHPQDAEDAAQEILIRVVTNLGSFRGDSAFTTWVFRIASNHLLTTRKRRMEERPLSFEEFGADLSEGLSDALPEGYTQAEQRLLVEEVKIGCTQAMLLCLDRDHRLAYIFGEIMELSGEEGAEILEITSVAFRKRLSRSRDRVRHFMNGHCGLVNAEASCRCSKRVKPALALGRVDSKNLLFAGLTLAERRVAVKEQIKQLDGLRDSAAVMRSNPAFQTPERILAGIRALLPSVQIPEDG